MASTTRQGSAEGAAKRSAKDRRREPMKQPRLGFVGMLRWFWRQLTSMRTALFLLLILAVAAIPGSIFPQRSIDASRVVQYLDEHQTIGPWLDKLGFFGVFSSPWFAAVYLLLVISLVGCILPRSRKHLKSFKTPLPRVPRRLERLPAYAERTIDAEPEQVMTAARSALGIKRYRMRHDPADDGGAGILAAEGGRLRETGNLMFHIALLFVIIAVAYGHMVGWRGDVIVPVGQGFTSTASRYDTLSPGPWVDVDDLNPFSMKIHSLDVTFEHRVPKSSPQYGEPRDFKAHITSQVPGEKPKQDLLRVNHALDIAGTEVYLLGNGYAPKVTVRNAKGNVLYNDATPFLTNNNTYKSVGAIKVTAGSPKQLGFFGYFLPTFSLDPQKGAVSTYPGLRNPVLVLGLYEGNLFPDGQPQSVYTLNTKEMTQVKGKDGQPLRLLLRPGETVKLPHGLGSITFDSVPRWAGLSVRHDPGKIPALIGALIALAGLIMSMTLRRRRIFVKAVPADGGDGQRTLITIGALSKGEDPRLQVAIDNLVETIDTKSGRSAT